MSCFCKFKLHFYTQNPPCHHMSNFVFILCIAQNLFRTYQILLTLNFLYEVINPLFTKIVTDKYQFKLLLVVSKFLQ